VTELANLDLLFYAADSAADLARIDALVPMLSEKGALWIVSLKGKAATVKDVDVMAAAKAHGLVDNKVVAFSPTLTRCASCGERPRPRWGPRLRARLIKTARPGEGRIQMGWLECGFEEFSGKPTHIDALRSGSRPSPR